MTTDPFSSYTRRVNPALGRFLEASGRDHRFVRGEGAALFDDRGDRWDDWVAGFGALPFGHDPPLVKDAIRRHLDGHGPSLFVEALNPFAGALAERLCALAGPSFETAFLCNSGAEAVEAAIKAAMAATGRRAVAYAAGGYHGTTLGALGCMARGLYRDPFAHVVDRLGFVEVPFGDLEALDRALAEHPVAAFVVEPVQMEGGVRIATPSFLRGAREITAARGALLVLDEVQTGLGRTGDLFAFTRAGIAPDVLVLAKALGGGVVPVGAAVMGEGVWRRAFGTYLTSEIHNTTFGGNALSCAVALAVIDAVAEPAFLAGVRARGEALSAALRSATQGSPVVARVTMLGLLGGIEITAPPGGWISWESFGMPELQGRPAAAAALVERLSRRRVLTQLCAHDWSVVRVEPPLIVDSATCERFVEAVAEAVAWLGEMVA